MFRRNTKTTLQCLRVNKPHNQLIRPPPRCLRILWCKGWGAAQRGFLLVWNWHIPRVKNGPVGVRTPRDLGGTIREGKGSNKTQAVVLHLIKKITWALSRVEAPVFLDNLIVSTRMVKYARSQGNGIIGTCRDNTGVIQELLDLKKKDKKDIIKWGETYSMPTENGPVCHVGWKDQAFVLVMSSVAVRWRASY